VVIEKTTSRSRKSDNGVWVHGNNKFTTTQFDLFSRTFQWKDTLSGQSKSNSLNLKTRISRIPFAATKFYHTQLLSRIYNHPTAPPLQYSFNEHILIFYLSFDIQLPRPSFSEEHTTVGGVPVQLPMSFLPLLNSLRLRNHADLVL
jgi:hypothetical protein